MIRYNDKSKEFENFLALVLYIDSIESSVSFECNSSNDFLKLEKNLIITEIKCKIMTDQFCKAMITLHRLYCIELKRDGKEQSVENLELAARTFPYPDTISLYLLIRRRAGMLPHVCKHAFRADSFFT